MNNNSKKNQNQKTKNRSPGRYQQNIRTYLPRNELFLALDCEMVGIGPGGQKSSVACVTVIDWHGGLLFQSLIKQTEKVTDYRTHISGITEKDLRNATMTLNECRAIISQLLHNRILVGHALQNDLSLLQITHPWWMIRDTASYAPFMKYRHDGYLWPRKLKHLAGERLRRDIQIAGRPHNAYEDALASIDLYKLVRVQWEEIIQSNMHRINSLHYIRLAHQRQLNFKINPTMQVVQ